MIRPLNLARRPLRNERLPTVLLGLALVILLGLSVRHAIAARDLMPERTATVDGELVALEEEVARLRSEARRLETRSAEPESLQEWAVVRDLVDQRAFSWSALMGHLEEVVPANIRLISIAPMVTEGQVEVELAAVGRTVEDGLAFLKALQESPRFQSPFLNSVTESSEGIDFSYTLLYVGEADGPPSPGDDQGATAPDSPSTGPAEDVAAEDPAPRDVEPLPSGPTPEAEP